jgi:hypothetical protein
MAAIKAVPEPLPDPKVGKKRRVSPTPAPYYNLALSIELAKVIHVKGGGSCDRTQLAALLGYKGIKNGSFLTRVAAAKAFGLVAQETDQLRLTPRGKTVSAPVTQAEADRAKIDAFLAVPLFKMVYDHCNGRPLPQAVGLKNLLTTEFQVVEDRAEPAVDVLLDSAEEAGFFRVAGNRSQMVMPLASTAQPQHAPPVPGGGIPTPDQSGRADTVRRGGNGGGGDGVDGIPLAIVGMLRELPPVGTTLTAKKRAAIIAAFSAFVALIYPDLEEDT